MRLKTSSLCIAIICFLAGVNASLFFTIKNKPTYDSATAKHRSIRSINEKIYQPLEAIRSMLDEQSIRLQYAEESLNYLLDLNEGLSQHFAQEVPYAIEEQSLPTQLYYEAGNYVNAQLGHGSWSAENALEVMQMNTSLSHEQRSEIGLKIIQAINSGQVEIEDISMPLF